MFTLLWRKMRNTKWMVLCLFIGFLLAADQAGVLFGAGLGASSSFQGLGDEDMGVLLNCQFRGLGADGAGGVGAACGLVIEGDLSGAGQGVGHQKFVPNTATDTDGVIGDGILVLGAKVLAAHGLVDLEAGEVHVRTGGVG